jgi:hypothetical protein
MKRLQGTDQRKSIMSRTLTVSDELYVKLERTARERGYADIGQLLEAWQANEADRKQRVQVVQQIDALRARLFAIYGEMPDSVELLRDDRGR